MGKTLDDFYNDLGARESSGNYEVINPWGFVGKYQMGEAAMVDAGYYKPKPNGNYNNKWDGEFIGKDGVYSLQDFLKNKQAQENAQKAFKQAQWRQLTAYGADRYIGKEINGVKITQSGLLAAAHLKGPGSVMQYLASNGKDIPKDKLGTSVETYMKKFGGYDVSEITGLKSDSTAAVHPQTAKPVIHTQPSQLFKVGIEMNVDKNGNHIFTPQEIGDMAPNEFYKNLPIIEQQLKEGLIKPQKQEVDYSGYLNPATGDSKIFSREAISQMTGDEYTDNESAIMAQLKSIGIPYESDLELASMRGGRLVYVRPYTREDGTEVRGHWRSAPTV